ncbi:MAG TPA: FAD-dependent oxidoreductase [Acidimicrobiales bacterium]|nr:FAD-dependent oxidoreductase [Acidimicrobiales bacterium]
MTVRFVIIGGGPAGLSAATTAARLGGDVTVVERDVVGGSANLWDCIPSKAMIATGAMMSAVARSEVMGLAALTADLDPKALRQRIATISTHLETQGRDLLASQGVRVVAGTARFVGPHELVVDTAGGVVELAADAVLVATGSRPRVPDWATLDGRRILLTREAYPPPEMPEHLIVVGSGVTGVEFVHMFRSLGCEVTLIVSRQQVLPGQDHEVAAALEDDFLRRGVNLLKGARAVAADADDDGVEVACSDGRRVRGSHAVVAIGAVPNSDGLDLGAAGVVTDRAGYVTVNHHCQSNVEHVYAAGDVSGRLPLASVASMQGRKVAEHVMGLHTVAHRHLDYDKAASAIFTEPEIATVGVAEAEAFAQGRKIRVTKVPYASTARALIDGDPRGFVKILSDPATGVVLGGSIVGAHASELISVIALAVTAGLTVSDIDESLLVHPALAEALAEAAE